MSEYKPEGATHLQDEKPPDEKIEPEELLEVTAGALSARASVPDPTDQILLSPNYTPGWPAGAPAGVTIHTEEGWHDPSVAWLRNPASSASAHFCIRRDGKIVQLLWERNRAWHAKSSGMYYFGIEHEG
jgi:N-acetyl-anhydromuramyl-L-alanine amidase AmpD